MKWTLMTVIVLAGASAAFCQEASASDLPEGREVVDRYVEVIGGREAIEKCPTRISTGLFKLPGQGVEGTMKTTSEFPDRFTMSVDLGAMGVMRSGYDGETGWMIMPMQGPILLEGKMLEQLKEQSRMDNALKLGDRVQSLTTEDLVKFADNDCYKVRVQYNGWHMYEYYNVETGLMAGFEGEQESPMGPINILATVLKYREFDGFLIPAEMSQSMMGMEQVLEITNVECAEGSGDAFTLPVEVEALKKASAPKEMQKN